MRSDESDPLVHAGKIWLFPGLGCRYVGMGADILGRDPAADDVVTRASEWLGYDVVSVCLEGSGRKHVPPRQESQVIYVISCAYAAALRNRGQQPECVAGHSLGSWAAAAACGVYDMLTGLRLLTRVEQLLEEHADGRGQAMGVIIGLEREEVLQLIVGQPNVWVANWNSPRQQVIAGLEPEVTVVLDAARERGVKQSRLLPAKRAMHTPLLQPVAAALRQEFHQATLSDPGVPFLSTHEGEVLTAAGDVAMFLCDALVEPVHWQTTIQKLRTRTGSAFLDVGPGNVLAGMLPFIDPAAAVQTASEFLDQQVSA